MKQKTGTVKPILLTYQSVHAEPSDKLLFSCKNSYLFEIT